MNYKVAILKALRDILVIALGVILAAALTYGTYIAKDQYHEMTRPLTVKEKCMADYKKVWWYGKCRDASDF